MVCISKDCLWDTFKKDKKGGVYLRYFEIFGIKIASGSKEELLKEAERKLDEGGSIATVNPEILYNALYDEQLYEHLSASLCIPDGIGVVKAIKRRGGECERFPGVELGEALLDIKPSSLALVGGKASLAQTAMDNLLLSHPLLRFGFVLDGYNYSEEEIIKKLKTSPPDIFFVCLGSPKQEIFIKRMKEYSEKTLFISLGGSVDIYAKKLRRAPRFMRKCGCEWLWRILRQPKRILRIPSLVGFVYEVLKEEKIYKKTAENVEKKP